MGQVDSLFRLQHIDDDLREGKQRLAQVIRLQRESQALLDARERAGRASAELQEGQTQQQILNREVSSVVTKAKRSEDRLYSGQVKNPKELADLQHEIDSLARRRSAMEDELLEAMIVVEDAQQEEAEAAETLRQVEGEWAQQQAQLKEEQATLAARLQELEKLRAEQLKLITAQSLAAYEGAKRRAGPVAVVALNGDRCMGCQVKVPTNLVKAADEGRLVNCDNCTRILCPA